ncbi:MAG: glycosyltransferase family 1 protein, partial [Bacteroidota bacterium]
MRIFLNTRFLTQPITGVQRFAIELVSALRERTDALTLVAPNRILHQDLAEQWGVHTFGRWGGHAWEQLELPAYLRQQQRPLLVN